VKRAPGTMNRRPKAKPKGSGSTPKTKPEHIPTSDELAQGITSKDLAAGNLPAEGDSRGVPAGGSGRKSSGPPVVMVKAGNAGGGFVLGMFAYVIGLTYLRDGKPGVQRWLRAKFFNETTP
jgi:hypothetical protein